MIHLILAAIGRTKKTAADLVAHLAATYASNVHNLGTIAGQDAANVNLDGGQIDGTSIGLATPEIGIFKVTREVHADLAGGNNGTNAYLLDFNAVGAVRVAPGGNYSLGFSNLPAANRLQVIYARIVNGGAYTFTPSGVTWISGSAPQLKASGTDWLYFFTVDGSVVWGGLLA
jgi:hypothetical protein